MHPDARAFIDENRICVLAVEMLDGSPHAATVHFAYGSEPPVFVFETYRDYRKCEPLFGRAVSRASIAFGFTEGSGSKTMQLDGTVQLLEETESALREMYLEKFPNKKEKAMQPKVVFFKFTPTWWRFTDWSKPEGKTVYLSDGTVAVMK